MQVCEQIPGFIDIHSFFIRTTVFGSESVIMDFGHFYSDLGTMVFISNFLDDYRRKKLFSLHVSYVAADNCGSTNFYP